MRSFSGAHFLPFMFETRTRKHIPKENYIGWTQMNPGGLLHDLSTAENEAISAGPEAFSSAHPGIQLFPDPFLAPRVLHDAPLVSEMIIVPGEGDLLAEAAHKLAAAVEKATGTAVAVKPASDLADGLLTPGPLVLVGRAALNSLSREILRRFQLGIFDAQFPGRGGWGVTCHGELAPGMDFRYILTFDESTMEAAIEAFIDGAIGSEGNDRLRWMHEVSPGPELQRQFLDFHSWLKGNISSLRSFDAIVAWQEGGFSRPYREVYIEIMTADYPDGVISNGRLIDIGVEALRYYQQVGDLRGLDLFREMIHGFWGYLNSSTPAIYPSDLDFRMGAFCDAWNWAEWHPSVSKEELDIVPKLLLGAMRIVHGYFLELWKYRHLERKTDPGRRGELEFRHNHETFPALCLMQAWRYFRRWPLADLPAWRDDSDYIFAVMRPDSFKYSENANSYEVLVPEHFLTWQEASGREIPGVFRDALANFARRQWLMRDNEYRMVDYGDSGLSGLGPSRPFIVSPWLDRSNPTHRDVIECEELAGGHFAPNIAAAIHAFTGLVVSDGAESPPAKGEWEIMPVDPLFGREFSFSGPADGWFDKLCLRQAWQPDAFYVAIEGIGACHGISHGHHEVNGVLRANFGGRIWLVSNGYGKPIGEKLAGKAYSGRQTGPIDHNMLLMKNAADDKPLLPPVNALLVNRQKGPVPFVTTELAGYGGAVWRRHVVVLDGQGLVVVDRVKPSAGGRLPDEVWLEWNVLGAIQPNDGGAVVEQNGVIARFRHFESGSCEWGENHSNDWHTILESGKYPHAPLPLRKAIIRANDTGKCGPDGLTFITGLWLDDALKNVSWEDAGSRLAFSLTDADKQVEVVLD